MAEVLGGGPKITRKRLALLLSMAESTSMKMSFTCLLALLLFSGCTKSPVEPTASANPTASTYIIGTVIEFGDGEASETYRVSG